jgi:hypothetical protein
VFALSAHDVLDLHAFGLQTGEKTLMAFPWQEGRCMVSLMNSVMQEGSMMSNAALAYARKIT